MNYVYSWSGIFAASLQNIWLKIAEFIPKLLGAIIIFILGWIIASLLSRLVQRLILMTRIEHLVDNTKVIQALNQRGLKFRLAELISWFIKWFFIIVVLTTIADIFQWTQVTNFLHDVFIYIPQVIIAIIILVIGFVAAQFIHEMVERAVLASKIADVAVGILAGVAKWSIIIFAALAALVQLQIATSLIQILFTGIIAALALALGLAFGLGGRDKAREMLDRFHAHMK